MPGPRMLSVGQCGFDQSTIASQLRHDFGAEVVGAATHEEALRALASQSFDLVLVNRVGDRDGATGTDLIRAMKADPTLAEVPVMLVSNYPEAQAEAVELGAWPGFGKSGLGSAATRERIHAALHSG